MNDIQIAALIDINSTIRLERNRPEITIKTTSKEVALLLSSALDMKIWSIKFRYVLTGRASKFDLIYEKYRKYMFFQGGKLDFIRDYISNKPVYDKKNPEKFNNYNKQALIDLKNIKMGILTGEEPEDYIKIFLDDWSIFQFTQCNEKYLSYASKTTQYDYLAKSYLNCLTKFSPVYSAKNNKHCIRLNKENSIKLANYLIPTSIYKDFFEIFIKGSESLSQEERLLCFNKIQNLKTITIDQTILNAETNDNRAFDKQDRKIQEKNKKIEEKEQKQRDLEEKRQNRKNLLDLQKIETAKRKAERLLEKKRLSAIRKAEKEKEKILKIQKIEEEILQGFKTCNKCNKQKPLIQFQPERKLYGGYRYTCKACCYELYVDLEERREKSKKWQKENPEKRREAGRKERQKPHNRIKASIKSRLRRAMFNKNGTFYHEIIGCSPKELQSHLEKQFKEGMSWDNYGFVWDVDHIIPCRAFDMTNKAHVIKCWNYRNLRPLIKVENYSKHDILPNGVSARILAKENPEQLKLLRNKYLEEMGIGAVEEGDTHLMNPICLTL